MNVGKYIIWSSKCDYADWQDYLEEEHPDLTDEERFMKMHEINGDYLEDVRDNLNIQLSRPVLVIADFGRWNGRFSGYREIQSGNIRDCLYSEYDATWYIDKHGDLRCDATHHDGTNHYLYRTYKDGVTDERIENLKNKIHDGKCTREDITRVTRRLGDDIAKVYGFPLSRGKSEDRDER